MYVVIRHVCLALLVFLLAPTGIAEAAPCWHPPVAAPVTDPFREPPCAWCPGNRGVEYGTPPGTTVRSVATGRVTFAGSVAGVVYLVVRHAGGRRLTYGNLSSTPFAEGDLVGRGSIVGATAGRLHLGLRDGERYIDPAPFIGVLRRRARLVPTDGSPPNAAGAPVLRCGVEPRGIRVRHG